MSEDKFVIYEDSNQKIEIDDKIHQYLSKTKESTTYILEKDEFDTLLYFTSAKIKESNLNFNNLIVIENIPVIKTQKNIALYPPYNVFNETLYYISDFFDLDKDKKEKANLINQFCLNANNGIKCYIFNKPIFNTYGFLTYQNKKENQDYLMFFSFKTLKEQISDYLDTLDLFNT